MEDRKQWLEENRRCTDDQGREVVVRNDNTPTDISIIYPASVYAPLRVVNTPRNLYL